MPILRVVFQIITIKLEIVVKSLDGWIAIIYLFLNIQFVTDSSQNNQTKNGAIANIDYL